MFFIDEIVTQEWLRLDSSAEADEKPSGSRIEFIKDRDLFECHGDHRRLFLLYIFLQSPYLSNNHLIS